MKQRALLLVAMIGAQAAWAQDSAAPMLPKAPGATGQMLLYLVLLMALFAGGSYLLRNGLPSFQPKLKGERKLNIAETRMLGNRQFLVVAEYENRKLLLGVCPGRIDYLCTLGSGAEPEFPKIGPDKADA